MSKASAPSVAPRPSAGARRTLSLKGKSGMNHDRLRARRRALLALFGTGLSAALQRALAQAAVARGVRSVQGEVTVGGKPAARGTPVRPGDSVATGKGALAVFGPGGERNIVTSTATIGIRGTGCYFEVEPARTYFCLCYGTADLAAAGSDQRASYTTTHHESPRYIYGDGRSRAIVPANVVNHTDAELIMLEGLAGRSPPRTFTDSPYMNNP